MLPYYYSYLCFYLFAIFKLESVKSNVYYLKIELGIFIGRRYVRGTLIQYITLIAPFRIVWTSWKAKRRRCSIGIGAWLHVRIFPFICSSCLFRSSVLLQWWQMLFQYGIDVVVIAVVKTVDGFHFAIAACQVLWSIIVVVVFVEMLQQTRRKWRIFGWRHRRWLSHWNVIETQQNCHECGKQANTTRRTASK